MNDLSHKEYLLLKEYVQSKMLESWNQDHGVADGINPPAEQVLAYEGEEEIWWCVVIYSGQGQQQVDIFKFEIGSDDDVFLFENVSDESHSYEFPIPEDLHTEED